LPFKKIYDTDTDSITDASYICDTEMTILHANSAFEVLTGLKNDKVVNKKCYYVFNNAEKTCKNLCTSSGRKNEGNYFAYHDSQILSPSKELKDVRFLIFPRYEKEKLTGYLVIIKDQGAVRTAAAPSFHALIPPAAPQVQAAPGPGKKNEPVLTDKKLFMIANELLKENELLKKRLLTDPGTNIPSAVAPGRLDAVSQNAPCGIFTVDQTRRITGWNSDAERISGYLSAEMTGKKCDIFMQAPCMRKCLMFSDDKKSVHCEECVIKTKDGRLLTVLRSFEIMTGADGRTAGAIETFEDITARKAEESRLNNLREDAEKALREKNSVIEKIAREMTLPLHSVTDFTSILEKSSLTDREKELLTRIKSNCESLYNLINILLDASKK